MATISEGKHMTPIERVAVAISGAPFPTKASLRKARAAIETMREPSEAMVDAGVGGAHGKNWGEIVANCHRAMIDTALSE